jgi:integrase
MRSRRSTLPASSANCTPPDASARRSAKSLTALAQVLDFAGVKDNPARDRIHVRLPREEREEPKPPSADQIETVLSLMARQNALAVLVLDATGMRVGELEEKGLRCGDLDEPNTRWRIRRAVEKGRRGRWVSCRPTSSRPSWRLCRLARTATRIAPYFPGSPKSASAPRSHAPVERPARRPGRHTTSGTAASASGIVKVRHGR